MREPGFFDDNFCKDWLTITGTRSRDGDVIRVTGMGAVGRQEKDISPNLATNTYQKIIVRVAAINGTNTTWGVKVYDGSSWFTVWTGHTDIGLFEATLPSGLTLTKIALLEEYSGSISNWVAFDYAAICKNSLLVPDLGDLVQELTITRPILNKGISGAKFSIPNFNGAYNGLVKGHDIVMIWLSRDDAYLGDPAYKVFGGRVVAPTNRGLKYGEFYIDLECHGHGYELNLPPSLLQKIYNATNGRTIIEDASALCKYVGNHPLSDHWFDNAGSSGSTDDRINSTHDVVYDEEVPMKVIQEILEKAKNPGAVQGFDIYEMSSGALVGHLRNSLDFVSPIASITPRSYRKTQDFHEIRNKIKVYGASKKTNPPGTDDWTESTSGWTSDGTLSADTDKQVGSYSIRTTKSSTQSIYLDRAITAFSCKFPKEYRFLHFWWKIEDSVSKPVGLTIHLYAPNSSNYFIYNIMNPIVGEWQEFNAPVGPDTPYGPYNGTVGSPDWGNIQKIHFYMSAGSSRTFSLFIDALYFGGARFVGEAEDAGSEGNYGTRIPDPEIDDSLKTDAECLARAQSILNMRKDPVVTLSEVTVDGDERYIPGDRQRIVVSNDNLDDYFRIVQVQHVVKETQWDSVLILSNEPQYVDYVFRLLQQATKLLERRS